jgi:hypothetical protein
MKKENETEITKGFLNFSKQEFLSPLGDNLPTSRRANNCCQIRNSLVYNYLKSLFKVIVLIHILQSKETNGYVEEPRGHL